MKLNRRWLHRARITVHVIVTVVVCLFISELLAMCLYPWIASDWKTPVAHFAHGIGIVAAIFVLSRSR